MYPKLKFKIDYRKDIKTFFAFVNEQSFDDGRNLEWAIFKKYPQFRKFNKNDSLKIKKTIVEKFVKSIYANNNSVVKNNILIYKRNWIKVEKNFHTLIDKTFLKYPWSKGKYIAYPTIWGMYPRFLEDKTFQVPYKYRNKKYVSVVIAHEMLHFIFYDYFYEHFSKYKLSDFDTWNISEIFNVVIQNSPGWLDLFGIKTMGYPEHKKIVSCLQKKYYAKINLLANNLIISIIKNLKTNKV